VREFATFEDALGAVVDAFDDHGPQLGDVEVVAVGHRVVHGGEQFVEPTLVDDDVVAAVEGLVPLAPLHNPANLEGIAVARKLFPDLPQVMVFDTAFHHTIPEVAHTYAVPRAWREEHHIRRYGFHGTSHAYVSREAAAALGRSASETNVIVLHLGNGASATAVRGGESVDTSMGLTPLEGLVMGTRSGDLDPAVLLYLQRNAGATVDELDDLLNRRSGLLGLAGRGDMRAVIEAAERGEPAARLAFDVYVHRLRHYIGAYLAVLGGTDALVFTAGVGENSAPVRAAALEGLGALGLEVDAAANTRSGGGSRRISPPGAPIDVLVIPTDEEFQIARETASVLAVKDLRP